MFFRFCPKLIVFCISFVCTDLCAQLSYVQAKAHVGSIIKHSQDITFDTDTPTYGLDLGIYWQTQGSKPWQELQHFPRFYINGGYLNLGEKDILGDVWSIYGGMELTLFRKAKSAMHFGLGFGYAYSTKSYDGLTNPANNAISSHFNNSIVLNLEYEHRFFDRSVLHVGIHILHYSNGSRKQPNIGLNIPALYIAVSPYQGSYEKDFFTYQNSSRRPKQRFGFGAYTQYAKVEVEDAAGDGHPIYVFGADVLYYLNTNNRVSLGYQYGINTSRDGIDAIRHSIAAGHEFLFGPWSLQLKAGYYLNRKPSWNVRKSHYFQVSPRFYFFSQSKSRTKFYANIKLKSHLFVAEYLSFGVGLVFH